MWNLFKSKSEQRSLTLEQIAAIQNTSGVTVNNAESLPAVYCAISTIADAVASLPVHLYKRTPEGKERAYTHHVERLLDVAPNDYQTPFELKQTLMRSALLHGNGYALVEYDGSGKPSELHNLHPTSCTPVRLAKNRIGYKFTDENGKEHALAFEQVLHIKHASDDGITGRSPITVCRENVGVSINQQKLASKLMEKGTYIDGILSTESQFKDDNAIKRIKDQWRQYKGSSNAGSTPLLENGLKYQPISMTNVDLQFVESRNFSVADIARIFKLSPQLLQDLSNGTYSNFAESNRAFLNNTLRPWLTNLEQAFAKSLISDRSQGNYTIEFNTKDLLRASTTERFESYDIAIRNGIISPNEARASENMPARTGGDEYSQSWLNQVKAIEAKN